RDRGRWRVPGERWRGGPCQVCQCLPGGAVRCVPYCPLRRSGCPQGQVLREGDGGSCCTCGPAGECGVPRGPGGAGGDPHPLVPVTALSVPAAGDNNATATPPGMVTALSPPAPAEAPGSP
ncbi:SSPO protein, partial [Erythrocercus mccallii]|nr:SSPO protein [Erythrocercus mccallii]